MSRRNARSKRTSKALGSVVGLLILLVLIYMQRTAPAPGSGIPSPTSIPAPRSDSEASPASTPAGSSENIRVGSWNIEWLGKPDDRSGPAVNIAQAPGDLADYILAADVSVLALQEIIASVNSRPIRSHELEAVIDILESKSSQNWEYVLFPGRQDGDQLAGVLWNAGEVTALDAQRGAWDQRDSPLSVRIPKGRSASGTALWNRPPHAMLFSAGGGKTDFAVVVVHMKADYKGDFAAHRAEEASALLKALPDAVAALREGDVVVLGDTNCTSPGEPALASIEKAGYIDTNSTGADTHWRGGAMDKIFVPRGQREFQDPDFEVMSDAYLRKRGMSPQEFKTRLSDHYMVVATIRIGADDD